MFRQIGDDQLARIQAIFVRRQQAAIERHAQGLERFAIEAKFGVRRDASPAGKRQTRADHRRFGTEIDVERDGVDEVGRRRVVLQADGLQRCFWGLLDHGSQG